MLLCQLVTQIRITETPFQLGSIPRRAWRGIVLRTAWETAGVKPAVGGTVGGLWVDGGWSSRSQDTETEGPGGTGGTVGGTVGGSGWNGGWAVGGRWVVKPKSRYGDGLHQRGEPLAGTHAFSIDVFGLGVGEVHIRGVDHRVAAVKLGLLPQLLDREGRLHDRGPNGREERAK